MTLPVLSFFAEAKNCPARMVTIGEKYVERVEKALVDTICLEHTRQMPMTVDACWQKIQPLGFSQRVNKDFVKDAYKRLDRDGHVKEENGRYTLTEDGREDIQKVETILRQVVGQFNAPTGVAGTTGTTGTRGV